MFPTPISPNVTCWLYPTLNKIYLILSYLTVQKEIGVLVTPYIFL